MSDAIRPIVMPKWGLAMQEGMVAKWLVEAGAEVKTGDEILDIETSKLANVFESPVAGPLRRQGGQVGMDRAERWIALSDGGTGLEDFLRDNFGRVDAVILDFYHAAEYLGTLSRALHPGDEEAAEGWRAEWCSRLKREGGE